MGLQAPPMQNMREAMLLLESYPTNVETPGLHDPLYLLMSDPQEEDHMRSLAAALLRYRNHPAHGQLVGLLGEDLQLELPTLETILRMDAPMLTGADPIVEVQNRLRRGREVRHILENRIQDLERHAQQMSFTANAMAMVGAILAIFAMIGWSSAFGWWEIPWIDPPMVETEGDNSGDESISE